jgi:hypothetical protein
MKALVLLGIVATAASFVIVGEVAQAAQTCSQIRDRCIKYSSGRSVRGTPYPACYSIHAECMQTGTWQSSGPYAARFTRVVRK